MKKLIPFLVLFATISCEGLKNKQIKGKYNLQVEDSKLSRKDGLEFTSTKASAFTNTWITGDIQVSGDFKVEDGYVYIESEQWPIKLKVINQDTLLLEESNLMALPKGKYVRWE